MERRCPLSLVVAPAGYGKSTLVGSWVKQCGMRAAWLSLDEGDGKLNLFVEYLLASLGTLFPEVGARLAAATRHSAAMPYAALARLLADELDTLDESFVLVLDDYHLIGEPLVHRFMSELLRYPPRALNLVIATRVEPPLPLAMMRVHDQVSEVRAQDLRFTPEEIAEYLHAAMDAPLDRQTLAILEETTEGWVAGLHLAALYLRNQEDMAAAAARFQGDSRFALGYLAVEVLARQQPEVQQFLVETSILQRMCPEMCDAVLGDALADGQSARILEQLERDNLFVVTLDDRQQWYRYHQLFQRLLEHRLRASHSTSEIAALFRRASRWCAGRHLVDEALRYALAAGDIGDAIQLVELNRHTALNDERWQQLEPWLQLLPRSELNNHPELLLLEAWVLHKRERLADIGGRLDRVEALLADGSRPPALTARMRGEIDTLRSQQHFLRADAAQTVAAAQRALDNLPLACAGVRSAAWFFLAMGTYQTHGLQPALAVLAEAARREPNQPETVRARLLIARGFMHWLDAEMPALLQVGEELLWRARRAGLDESIVWGHYFLGCAHYQLDQLAPAAECFLSVMDLRHTAPGFVFVQGAFGLVSTLVAQGKPESAQAAVEMISEYVQETSNSAQRASVEACRARFDLAQGKRAQAFEWVASAERIFRPRPLLGFCAPQLAISAILAAQDSVASVREAEQLLQQLDAFLAATHSRLYRIEVLVQRALLLGWRQQGEAALAALGEAVELAQKGQVRRILLDTGSEVSRWLAQLTGDGIERTFAGELRSVVLPWEAILPVGRPRPNTGVAPEQPRHPDLIELLTGREMEVLQLLAQRATNKEIAQALGISTDTVKQHAMNLYRKLHAENRREAIVQARAMGFRFDRPDLP